MLFDWYRGFMSAEMLAKPLDEVFTIDEEPQDVQAEQTAVPPDGDLQADCPHGRLVVRCRAAPAWLPPRRPSTTARP